MSAIDVTEEIAIALSKVGNDPQAAQRLLVRQCQFDDDLLRGLAEPHLKSIVAHAIARHLKATKARAEAIAGERQTQAAAAKRTGRALSDGSLDAVIGHLGRSIGQSKEPRGVTALIRPTDGPPKAGARHEKTMRLLAKVYAHNRMRNGQDR